ncbi:MAG TPA: TIGR00730 family Rossman fold protein [Nitriliruptorales bacterium]
MIELRRVCVFCGSSPGGDPAYAVVARDLGRALAAAGIGLVYGGGTIGLMGVLADAVLEGGGEVTGVIPDHLKRREIDHPGVQDLRVVQTMHERKALMHDLSDAFVALPGGLGTMEELFEIWTWLQLGLHAKPIGLLQVAGYFDGLLGFLDHAVEEGFVQLGIRRLLVDDTDPDDLLARLEDFDPPATERWIGPEDR